MVQLGLMLFYLCTHVHSLLHGVYNFHSSFSGSTVFFTHTRDCLSVLEDVNMVSISREQQIRAASIWPCSQTSYYCEHKWFSCLVACTSLVQVQVFSYCELGKPQAQNTCCRHSKSCLFLLLGQIPFALSPMALDHSCQRALVGVDAPGSSMLFKTLKCGLRCYFHRYIKEQSPSIYLLLDHQLDGWMLIVSLWTLIWLIAYYGELNLLNVCKL